MPMVLERLPMVRERPRGLDKQAQAAILLVHRKARPRPRPRLNSMAAPPTPASTIMVRPSMPPPIAAVVPVTAAAIVAKAKIHFHGRAVIAGVAAVSVIRIIAAGVGRPIHRASPQPGSEQQAHCTPFYHTHASNIHLNPRLVSFSSVYARH